MRYLWTAGGLAACLCMAFSGCSVTKLDSGKVKELSYEIVEEADIPEEMRTELGKREKNAFLFTYADRGILYIARGYGEQETDGYAIQVRELYESRNAILLETELIGPESGSDPEETPTCPYLVIQTEYSDKYVVIQ